MKNDSGIIPMDLRVLVFPDPPETKIGSIIIPDSKVDQDKYAQQKATVVAVGENAWEEAAARSAAFVKPSPADRVLIGRYSGNRIKGADGQEYVIMNDEDIIARLEE